MFRREQQQQHQQHQQHQHEKRRRLPTASPPPVMPVTLASQQDPHPHHHHHHHHHNHNDNASPLDASCWAFPLLDIDYPAARRSAPSAQSHLRHCYPGPDFAAHDREERDRRARRSPSPSPSLKRTKRSVSYGCLRPAAAAAANMSFLPRQNRNNLQLPSFESLGIAIPSPPNNNDSGSGSGDNNSENGASRKELAAGEVEGEPPSLVTDDASSLPSSTSPSSAPNLANSYASPLPVTPPEYDDSVRWTAAAPPDPSSSSSSTPDQPHQTPTPVNGDGDGDGDDRSHGAHSPQPSTSAAVLGPPPIRDVVQSVPDPGVNVTPDNDDDADDPESWLQNVFAVAVSALPISKTPGQAVQLISQSLPSPPSSSAQPASPLPAYVAIVQAIQRRLQPGLSPYINIIHAVPPKFSLSNLPTSPPSTPNLLSPGDDYFNLTVFSSATPVSSYPHPDLVVSPIGSSPPYVPAPIVPPYSVHVAVVERYLPPPTAREYRDMFSMQGPSVLVDRLRELSPNDGTLVLVYPTRQGAQTFVQHYLSPILDPLLRQLVVVKSLSADVGMALGQMDAVSEMDDFETMAGRIQHICHALNADGRASSSSPHHLSASTGAQFHLAHASKGPERLDRKLWTEWHIQQDTPRVRAVLRDHWYNRVRPRSHDGKSTGTSGALTDSESSIMRELFEGFRQRSYSEPDLPAPPMELGVFVIRRSQ